MINFYFGNDSAILGLREKPACEKRVFYFGEINYFYMRRVEKAPTETF
ncbi:hypothetical protein BTEBP_150018 [Brochothrix thermosphacta]|nr:hypothetical protein BTEBP_150018 [Brochothrix thermosphacta]